MRANMIYKENYEEMSREAAAVMRSVIDRNPDAVIVLATGHSPRLAYQYLTEGLLRDSVDVGRLTFVKLDEWIGLSADDEATCEYFIRTEILDPLSVKEEQYLHFNPEAKDAKEECRRVEKEYRMLTQIDLVILGIGMNGHLGLNEPGETLDGTAHSIRLDEKTKTHEMLSHAQKRVEYGVTLGMEELFRGKQILLLADGTQKKMGLEYYMNDIITTKVPVSLLKLHPDCKCIVNKECFEGLVGR